MKKYVVLIVLIAIIIVLVIWVEPTGRVRGRLRGEKFFASRPTSYWADALRSEDAAFSNEANQKLRGGGEEAAAVLNDIILNAQDDPESVELLLMATDLLGRTGDAAQPYSDTLLEMLNHPDTHVRAVAARNLPKIGTQADTAVPALTKLLDQEEKVDVARALSEYQEDAAPALPKLVEVMNDKSLDSETRWNAARTLGKMHAAGAPAIPDLVACLTDDAPTVREHAAEALGDIGPGASEAVDPLIATLKDEVPRVRRDAARALGQIGVKEPKVIEALQQMAHDPEAEVQEFSANALKALGVEAAEAESRP